MGEAEAREAVQKALAELIDSPSPSVSPADYGVTAEELYAIADELRKELHPGALIEWSDDGSLRFDTGLL